MTTILLIKEFLISLKDSIYYFSSAYVYSK